MAKYVLLKIELQNPPLNRVKAVTALSDITRHELICLKIDTFTLKTHSGGAAYDSAPSEHFF